MQAERLGKQGVTRGLDLIDPKLGCDEKQRAQQATDEARTCSGMFVDHAAVT